LAASNGDGCASHFPPLKMSQGCSSFSCPTRRKSCAVFGAVMPEGRMLRCSQAARLDLRLATRSRHKRCYLQSRLMRRCPLCGASGARVSAVSPRVSRPPARFIEDNIVLSRSRRRRCHARCGAAPRARSAQRTRQLAVHPSRPPRTQRIAKSWRVNQTLLDETSQRRRTKIIG